MMSTQHQSEARNRTAITTLPTRLAPRNRPTGERSRLCMPPSRFAPRGLYCALGRAFQPQTYSRKRRERGHGASRKAVGSRDLSLLHQQAQQGASGRSLQLLRVDRPIVVRVGPLESDFHEGEVLSLADRLIVVRVGDLPVLR